jgi:glycosyltransferase involved in cell wall biosynthesis
MHIGIDARMHGPEQGGLGRYIEQLVKHLEKLTGNEQFTIFLRQANWDQYQPSNPRFKKKLADIPWYGWKEQILLPKILRSAGCDLVHFPHWNVPFLYRQPYIATIHDLLLFHYPTRAASTLGPFGYWFKNQAFKKIIFNVAAKAKKIITVSRFSEQDIHQALGVPLDRLSVTYLGSTLSSESNQLASPSLTATFSPTKPYAIYVGVAFPHKNLPGLLRAWKKYQEKYGDNFQLVLVGKKNYFYRQLLENFSTLFAEKKVIYTDFIPDTRLSELYTHARLYIFPSLYEGFGLPPLEAMRYSLPVLSSNQASLPEILQNAACYTDTTNEDAFAEAIHRNLTDIALRQKLITRGQKLYPQYSWQKLAEETLAIYRNSV